MVFKSTGKISISDSAVRMLTDLGISQYYKSLIELSFHGLKTDYGLYKPHVTIITPKHHAKLKLDFSKIKKWRGKKIEFTYEPYVYIGAVDRPYRNFYLKVKCPELDEIKKTLKVKEDSFLGYHITICNTKNTNMTVKTYYEKKL